MNQLLTILQNGLPLCDRPFAKIAQSLNSDEQTILNETIALEKKGIVKRIGAMINYRAIGKVSTLVTAHIEEDDLPDVAAAINKLQGVSHNYLRRHNYNLWFTLQADSKELLSLTLSKLSARFAVDFHSMPVQQSFKLNVRFDLEDDDELVSGMEMLIEPGVVELTDKEKIILSKIQNGFRITAEPFAFLADANALAIIEGLIQKAVIKRIAAVLDHRKLGFTANVMFVCKADPDKVIEAGQMLARFAAVSHCYQRKTFTGWDYNLFAMMHAQNMNDIQRVIDKFTKAHDVESFELLPTEQELKKEPVRHTFGF